MRRVHWLVALAWITALLALGGATSAPEEARPIVSSTVRPSDSQGVETVYGPIRAKDPLQRARIKQLYIELQDFRNSTMITLAALGKEYTHEVDPDFRAVIAREITDAKVLLERRNMELGLEIARLNEDTARVKEFEQALEAFLNPHRPAPLPDAERTSEPIPGQH